MIRHESETLLKWRFIEEYEDAKSLKLSSSSETLLTQHVL